MRSYPTLGRWLAATFTALVFGGIIIVGGLRGTDVRKDTAGDVKSTPDTWPMYGGDPNRNMVNTHVKGLPVKWDVDAKNNVVWVADLGSKAYGGPIVVDGKVIIGTNNQKPRQKSIMVDGKQIPLVNANGKPVDLGVIMCFDEKKGDFLWQQVFFKLAAGQVNDWPYEGICSTPVVDGDRFYYVSNRCELVCAGLGGQIHWKLDMIRDLNVFPHNIAACSPLVVGNDVWLVTANGVNEDHINVP